VTRRASWNGQVLAESDQTEVVEGNHCFRAGSLRREHLAPSGTHSLCPWKGRASYYDVTSAGAVNPAAAWYYPKPWPPAPKICDHVAFWNGVAVVELPDRP
jgi:uncharacterized protein (DUF427 family)